MPYHSRSDRGAGLGYGWGDQSTPRGSAPTRATRPGVS